LPASSAAGRRLELGDPCEELLDLLLLALDELVQLLAAWPLDAADVPVARQDRLARALPGRR
jgi:hypothetical protein